MSADDTDTDKAPKKSVSLTHKGKGVEIEQHREIDQKMKKKDKAAQAIKKEFKKQMDLTKNMGEEPEKPAVKVAKKTVKAEAKKKATEAPKTEAAKAETPKDEAIKEEKPKEKKEDKQTITPAKLLAKKSPVIQMPAESESKSSLPEESPADKPIESAEEKPAEEKAAKPEAHKPEHKKKSAVKESVPKDSEKPKAADRGVEEKATAAPTKEAPAKTQSVVQQGTMKQDAASYKELEEMSTFSQEEDKAIEAQFDGEELVKAIGGLAGKSISKDIKHANPRWVTDKSSKWGKGKLKSEADAAKDAKEEKKEEAEGDADKKDEKKDEEKKALAEEAKFVEEM